MRISRLSDKSFQLTTILSMRAENRGLIIAGSREGRENGGADGTRTRDLSRDRRAF